MIEVAKVGKKTLFLHQISIKRHYEKMFIPSAVGIHPL
jgi:hypothetical protein